MKQKRMSNGAITKKFNSTKGSLHKATGTKPGQKIPKGKLLSAANKGNKLAQLAYNLNKNK